MANKCLVGILSGVGGALLIGMAVVTIVMSDREAPVITVPEDEITYREGEDESELLLGVTAYDGKDGDVSESVIIENIIQLGDKNVARVIYAARDKHNNIGNAERYIIYYPLEMEEISENEQIEVPSEEIIPEEPKAERKEEPKEEPKLASDEVQTEEQVEEKLQEEESSEPTEEEIKAQKEKEKQAQAAQRAAKAKEEAEKKEREELEKKQQELALAAAAEAEGAPHIALTEHHITTYQHQYFNAYAYIASATDDKDYVMGNLHVDSNVNTSIPGTYSVSYYCTDSEGNKSNVETLTVVVLSEEQ